jgi:hypothetical protein
MYDGGTLAVQLSSLSPHHPRRAPLKIDQIAMVFRGFVAYLRDHPDRCRLAVAIKWPDRYLILSQFLFVGPSMRSVTNH